MNIAESFRRWFPFGGERRERETYELNKDDQKILEMLGIEVGSVNVKGKNALKVETVYSCIRILSETVAKLPLKVYQEDEAGIQKSTRHDMYRLLKLRPNPYMSTYDFFKTVEAQRALYGNAYVSIEFDYKTGRIIGLWPVEANKVKVMIDSGNQFDAPINPKSRLWYEIDLGGEKRKVLPHEMLHFKGGITLDGIVGISAMEYLRCTVENAASAGKFVNNFFKQGLQARGIIQYVGDLSKDAQDTFRKQFENMSSGLKNSHRVTLMPIGYKYEPIALSMQDAQFLQNTELTIRQIAAAFGIKMHQLNDLSKSTHSNIEQQQQQFYTDTLQAVLTGYEQEMTYKLFLDRELDDGFYVRFNVDAILRADIKTRYAAYKDAIQGGFMSPNQVRGKEEMEPMPGGDVLIVNGNMIPLIMAGQQWLKKGGEETEREENPEEPEGDPSDPDQTGDPAD